jgi:hypothetical protein
MFEEFTLVHGILQYFRTEGQDRDAGDEDRQRLCLTHDLCHVLLNDPPTRLISTRADDPLREPYGILCIRAAYLNTNGTQLDEAALARLCDGMYSYRDREVFFAIPIIGTRLSVGQAPGRGDATRRIGLLVDSLLAGRLCNSGEEALESVARILASPPTNDRLLLLERGHPTFDESLPALLASIALRCGCDDQTIRHEPLLHGRLNVLLAETRVLAFINSASPPTYRYTATTRPVASGVSTDDRLARFMRSMARAHTSTDARGLWNFISGAMDCRLEFADLLQRPFGTHLAHLPPYADRFNALGHGGASAPVASDNAVWEIQAMFRNLAAFIVDDDTVEAQGSAHFRTARYVISYQINTNRSLRCVIAESDAPTDDIEDENRYRSGANTPEVVD